MDKGLTEERVRQAQEPGQYSPLVLAYIGDAVYETMIRARALEKGSRPVSRIYAEVRQYVNAGAQAEMHRLLEELLTEEEKDIFRRGRNAHSHTMAKNASMSDYRAATGFEALVGYLWLKRETGRLEELVDEGILRLDRAKQGMSVRQRGENKKTKRPAAGQERKDEDSR